jgi:predicted YcjX-like family ATPase
MFSIPMPDLILPAGSMTALPFTIGHSLKGKASHLVTLKRSRTSSYEDETCEAFFPSYLSRIDSTIAKHRAVIPFLLKEDSLADAKRSIADLHVDCFLTALD